MTAKNRLPVLLFDGECNLCNGSVRFILKYDRTQKLSFASLNSDYGQQLFKKHDLADKGIDSIVFVDEDGFYLKSAAFFKTLDSMGGPWQHLKVFGILPKAFTDRVYDFIARNRYKVFGRGSCIVPTPEQKKRFIDL